MLWSTCTTYKTVRPADPPEPREIGSPAEPQPVGLELPNSGRRASPEMVSAEKNPEAVSHERGFCPVFPPWHQAPGPFLPAARADWLQPMVSCGVFENNGVLRNGVPRYSITGYFCWAS